MEIEKLKVFYFKKLSEWQLIHSFLKRYWVIFISIALLMIAFFIVALITTQLVLLIVSTILLFLGLPFVYYLLIIRRARKYIRIHYRLNNFDDIAKLKRYILAAYLRKNGFATKDDLDRLLVLLDTTLTNKHVFRQTPLMLTFIFGLICASIFTVLIENALFPLYTPLEKIITAVLLLIGTILLYFLIRAIWRLVTRGAVLKLQSTYHLKQEIIVIQTLLLVGENTTYHPFLEMKSKVEKNDFLTELVNAKTFF